MKIFLINKYINCPFGLYNRKYYKQKIMDYGVIRQSSVPHVTTIVENFQIEYSKYVYTLVVQCSFIILILPLLGIWIYFSAKAKNQKSKRGMDQNQQQDQQFSGEGRAQSLHLSEVDAKSIYVEDENHQDYKTPKIKSMKKVTMKLEYNIEQTDKVGDQALQKKFKLVERKICYGVCFFILHVVAVNSFDSGLISIVTFYCLLGVYLLFNLIWPKKKVYTFGLYIIPAIVSAFQFWLGKHILGQHIS